MTFLMADRLSINRQAHRKRLAIQYWEHTIGAEKMIRRPYRKSTEISGLPAERKFSTRKMRVEVSDTRLKAHRHCKTERSLFLTLRK